MEANRRGVNQFDQACVKNDGAPWIWNLVHEYFWNATQIVDLYQGERALLDLRMTNIQTWQPPFAELEG